MSGKNITVVPALRSSTSQHEYNSEMNSCIHQLKAHYIKIFICCVALAAIGIYCIHVHRRSGTSDHGLGSALNVLESSKNQVQTKGGNIIPQTSLPSSHQRSYFWKVLRLHQSSHLPRNTTSSHPGSVNNDASTNIPTMNESSFKEFNLESKRLYVLSKIHPSADNQKHERETKTGDPSARSSSGFTSGVQLCESLGMQAYYSSSSSEGMFYCSELLPSILNIFFLETSCASNMNPETNPTMSEKKACSIYSAALHNPSRKVILLFTCPFPQGYNWTKDWNILFNLQNFFFGRVNLTELYAGTPLSDMYHRRLSRSSYPVAHQSDLFRIVVLYFYGGAYMDMDVISLRALEDLGLNFIGNQGPHEDNVLGNSVLHFEPNHQFLKACLIDAIENYAPTQWKAIGPKLVTSTVKKYCNVSEDFTHLAFTTLTSCNITILPEYIFYAVEWANWEYFYEPAVWSYVKTKLAKSYGAHYWNHMGHRTLFIRNRQPIVRLAEQHCAPVYINAGAILS